MVADLPLGEPDALRHWVIGQLREGVRRDGDWRPAMDALRSLTAPTWQASGERAQRDLLADAWAWNACGTGAPRPPRRRSAGCGPVARWS